MKVIFAGGGTLGSVNPLIAIWQDLSVREASLETLWLGTKTGPEKLVLEKYGIAFKTISTGKWRRYISWRNLVDPFKVLAGFFQAQRIIKNFKPNLIISAGGFVAVPVVWAAKSKHIPSLIHQQDLQVGLANKLMAKPASHISVTFEASIKELTRYRNKISLIGNPVRQDFFQITKKSAQSYFNLKAGKPVVLILGGGTGAATINSAVSGAIESLVQFAQVIHLTGVGRGQASQAHDDYHSHELLIKDFPHTLAAADVVVSRAGMATLTEAAILKKPLILIPMSLSHQELNAQEFQKNNAAKILLEKNLTPQTLVAAIKSVLDDPALQKDLALNSSKVMPPNANTKMIDLIYKLIE